ncbi:hypothetical protein ACJ41O_009601 [Fusarium nematophilum]
MGKVSALPIIGGPAKPLDTQEEHRHITDDLPNYEGFPYSRLTEAETASNEDEPALVDKNSPQYRERLREILNGLQDAYQVVNAKYDAQKRGCLETRERLEQLEWNICYLNPKSSATHVDSVEPIHHRAMVENSEARTRTIYELEKQQVLRYKLKEDLYEIEWRINTGLREMARLDNSESFLQLRNAWVSRQAMDAGDGSVTTDWRPYRPRTHDDGHISISCPSSSTGSSRNILD